MTDFSNVEWGVPSLLVQPDGSVGWNEKPEGLFKMTYELNALIQTSPRADSDWFEKNIRVIGRIDDEGVFVCEAL